MSGDLDMRDLEVVDEQEDAVSANRSALMHERPVVEVTQSGYPLRCPSDSSAFNGDICFEQGSWPDFVAINAEAQVAAFLLSECALDSNLDSAAEEQRAAVDHEENRPRMARVPSLTSLRAQA